MSQSENMAAVTEDDNPGQLPAAGGEAADAAAAAGSAGEEGDLDNAAQDNAAQDNAAEPGEPDGRAGPADAAADDAAAPPAGVDEAPGADEDEEAPEQPSRDVADLEQESEIAADYVEGLLDVDRKSVV